MADPKKGEAPASPESGGEASGDSTGLIATKKEFIQTFFKRGEEFAETLLRENERLRFQVADLEEQLRQAGAVAGKKRPMSGALRELVTHIEALEKEHEKLMARFRSVELENQSFEDRYREIERENNNLANLYVASYQLHSTLDLREITQIILEILLNFVGAHTFAIQLVDDERGRLRTLAADGVERKAVPEGAITDGQVGQVIAAGAPVFVRGRFAPR